MPEYTVLAALAVLAVVGYELRFARTGLLRSSTYWLTMAIVLGFQCVVDGWLTRLDHPIVRYDPSQISGIRFPWDIPVEDFLFGFALLTLVLVRWHREAAEPTGTAA